MQILGITGGSGGGKTTVLRQAKKLGALLLDCDEIYHELLISNPQMLWEIENRFPGTVENGALNRKKLGGFVFHDPKALQDLNAITHRYVKDEVLRRIGESKAPFAVIDAIALFESGLDKLCDATVAVTAPMERRVARLMAREGISEDYARARIQAQKPDSYYETHCTHIIYNDYSTLAAMEEAADRLLRRLTNTEEKECSI